MAIQFKKNSISQSCIIICLLFSNSLPASDSVPDLPPSLVFEEILKIAKERRAEIRATQERINASRQRETVLSALEDPMIIPSIDHWPYGMSNADVSLGIEQRFPLSRIRGQRKQSAQAQTRVVEAEAFLTTLDVQVNAADAFLMLYERRRMFKILQKQKDLLMEIVAAVNARYRSGSVSSTQADVIRSEVELARIDAQLKSLQSEIKASEAMFNASINRQINLPIPELVFDVNSLVFYDSQTVIDIAISRRPEIDVAQAQIEGAVAQVHVMRSMYWPMLTVKAGPAYTMVEGSGLMFMLGVSLPVWRGKLHAGVAETQAMERMARADLEATQNMIEGEVMSAYYNVVAEKTRYSLLRNDVLARTNQSISPMLSGYATGLLPLVSLIEAVRMLLMTEMELIQAEVSVGSYWVRLKRAMGTLEEKPDE